MEMDSIMYYGDTDGAMWGVSSNSGVFPVIDYGPMYNRPTAGNIGRESHNEKSKCDYCHAYTKDDSRGHCAACGAPRYYT